MELHLFFAGIWFISLFVALVGYLVKYDTDKRFKRLNILRRLSFDG